MRREGVRGGGAGRGCGEGVRGGGGVEGAYWRF